MALVKAEQFKKYAGRNLERWNLLIGKEIIDQRFGRGSVVDVAIKEQDISIWIEFDGASGDENKRCFGHQVMNFLKDIEFPVKIAQQIIANQPEVSSPPRYSRRASQSQTKQPTGSEPPALFQVNDKICLVKDPSTRGIVHQVSGFFNNEWNYEIYFSADHHPVYKESDIKLDVRTVQWGGLDDLMRDLAMVKLHKPMGDALYALYGSRTKFEVYQFKPALKFLANPDQRLLIADEVGLGKTIEAGIIFLELQARIGLERVLIVCPSSLKQKWQDEMKSRFDEDFVIWDMQSVNRFLDQNQHLSGQLPFRAIISLELIRMRGLAERFTDVKLDLLIIDEAHHCRNTATLAHAVASTLTENSDAALLLTATPLQMGQADLFNLLSILSPGEFDNFNAFANRLEPNQYVNRAAQYLALGNISQAISELQKVEKTTEKQRFTGNPYYQTVLRILKTPYPNQEQLITAQRRLLELNTLSSVFTRTRKRDVQEQAPKRTAQTLTVVFTPEEKRFYDQVVDEVREDYFQRHWSGAGSGWITIMKERQAASCISALMKKQAEKDHISNAEEIAFEEEFISIEAEDVYPDETRIRRQIVLPRPVRVNIKRDSKFEVFWSALQKVLADDPKCKVLVFSFFVGTIEHITAELQRRGVNARAIHGGYKVSDRQAIIEAFRDDPSIRVLVSSDVGSEGLDFQFCDTLFNYDLPWNPMKVEQRIGRIDRFGQESDRLRIYNLVIEDSIESRILMRLYDRIEIFKQSIGDIEVILGDQIRELTQAVFSNRLTKEEEIQRAEQAAVNILRQKQDMEEFEQKRLQFLGQEAILSTTVNRTIESGRFISDVEVRALVDGLIRDKFPLSRLDSNGDETYALHVNNDFSEYLKAYIYQQKKNDRTAQQFLTRLSPGKIIPLTFSHDLAYKRKLLEFITPRHPLAQAALDHWKLKSQESNRLAKFKLRTPVASPGLYTFFIFSMNTKGIDEDSRMISIVISTESGDKHNELSKQFIRLTQTSALQYDVLCGRCDENEIAAVESDAILHMTNIRDNLYKELSTSNDAIVNARRAAVEQTYQAKKTNIENRLQKVNDTSIVRMYQGQLRNLTARKLAKVADIEKGKQLDVNFELKLRGYVEVVEPV